MKKLVLATAIAASTFGAVSTASAVEVSANAALTTDYKFRGISQTNSGPAFQGGFDVDFGNGFYLGNWNSNVNFGGGTSGLEMDVYGGYAGEFKGVSYDLGLLKYYYEGSANVSPDPDTLEVYGNLGYAGFSLGVSYSLGKDYFALTQAGVGNAAIANAQATDLGGSTYVKLGYEYALAENISLAASYGITSYSEDIFSNGARIDGYTDYSLGVTYTVGKFDLGAAVVGTDNDAERAFGKDGTETSLIVTVGTSF
jgi:uncharacterized protein (TIGR02001 family)